MLCRNRVEDYAKWRAVFDSHRDAHREVGLRLVNMWRSVEDPNNIFFLIEVASIEKATRFINSPESAKAGEESGVVDGEVNFVEDANNY